MKLTTRAFLTPALGVTLGQCAFASDFAVDASRPGNSAVRYRDAAKLTDFPVPVISIPRGGLSAGAKEAVEIREKLLYPLIERSRKAISVVVLEWYPSQPDALGGIVIWSDGETSESIIARASGGTHADRAYESLLAKPTP